LLTYYGLGPAMSDSREVDKFRFADNPKVIPWLRPASADTRCKKNGEC
jgi:hypothetical protein